MIEPTDGFQIPAENQNLWHYMKLWQFKSLVEKRKLFFSTIDRLRKDPRSCDEGSWGNFRAREYISADDSSESKPFIWEYIIEEYLPKLANRQQAVHCWSLSGALWWNLDHLYDGVAINTTFGNLKDSFLVEHPDWPICGGNFQDKKARLRFGLMEYRTDLPENTTTSAQAMFLTNNRQHEMELRIVAVLAGLLGAPHSLKNLGKADDDSLGLSKAVLEQVKQEGGIYLPVESEFKASCGTSVLKANYSA